MRYKLHNDLDNNEVIIRFNDDNSITSFVKNEANTDYQAYLAWLAEGNQPLPADA